MKKERLNFRNVAIMLVASLSLLSCSDNNDDYITYYSARATVISESDQQLTLKTDGGNQITVVSDYSGYSPMMGQRTAITYSIEDGDNNYYNASLHTAHNILTKEVVIMTEDNETDMGNDPIHLYNAWCAGGYLNINFGFNTSGSVTHYVNLVENSLVQNPNDGKIYLEFRHNAMGDSECYGKRGTVCYDLTTYQDGNNIITFVVKFTEFDGVITTREIEYDFANDTVVGEESSEIGEGLYE